LKELLLQAFPVLAMTTNFVNATALDTAATQSHIDQPVRFVVNNRGLFTAGWFGVREKYCSSL